MSRLKSGIAETAIVTQMEAFSSSIFSLLFWGLISTNSSLHLVDIILDTIIQCVIVRGMFYLLHTGFMTDMYVILRLLSFHLRLLYARGMQSAVVELARVCTIHCMLSWYYLVWLWLICSFKNRHWTKSFLNDMEPDKLWTAIKKTLG